MEKLPRITAIVVIRVLKKAGFFLSRQSGSHRIFKNVKGQRVTVPFHKGKTIHPKVLNYILRDADISVEEFKKYLK